MQRSAELAINSEVAFVDLRFTRALNFEKQMPSSVYTNRFPEPYLFVVEVTTSVFEKKVDIHLVRDEEVDANHWLIGSGWLRVRFRVSYARPVHRVRHPFSRISGKPRPSWFLPFTVAFFNRLFL